MSRDRKKSIQLYPEVQVLCTKEELLHTPFRELVLNYKLSFIGYKRCLTHFRCYTGMEMSLFDDETDQDPIDDELFHLIFDTLRLYHMHHNVIECHIGYLLFSFALPLPFVEAVYECFSLHGDFAKFHRSPGLDFYNAARSSSAHIIWLLENGFSYRNWLKEKSSEMEMAVVSDFWFALRKSKARIEALFVALLSLGLQLELSEFIITFVVDENMLESAEADLRDHVAMIELNRYTGTEI